MKQIIGMGILGALASFSLLAMKREMSTPSLATSVEEVESKCQRTASPLPIAIPSETSQWPAWWPVLWERTCPDDLYGLLMEYTLRAPWPVRSAKGESSAHPVIVSKERLPVYEAINTMKAFFSSHRRGFVWLQKNTAAVIAALQKIYPDGEKRSLLYGHDFAVVAHPHRPLELCYALNMFGIPSEAAIMERCGVSSEDGIKALKKAAAGKRNMVFLILDEWQHECASFEQLAYQLNRLGMVRTFLSFSAEDDAPPNLYRSYILTRLGICTYGLQPYVDLVCTYIQCGYMGGLLALIEAGFDCADWSDERQSNLLHYAVWGRTQALFLQNRRSTQARNRLYRRHSDIIRLLISCGVNKRDVDVGGHTPIDYMNTREKMAELINPGPHEEPSLNTDMIINGDLISLAYCVDHGQSVDWKDERKNTLLHLLWQRRPYNASLMAEFLLARGASVDEKNNAGVTMRTLICAAKDPMKTNDHLAVTMRIALGLRRLLVDQPPTENIFLKPAHPPASE